MGCILSTRWLFGSSLTSEHLLIQSMLDIIIAPQQQTSRTSDVIEEAKRLIATIPLTLREHQPSCFHIQLHFLFFF